MDEKTILMPRKEQMALGMLRLKSIQEESLKAKVTKAIQDAIGGRFNENMEDEVYHNSMFAINKGGLDKLRISPNHFFKLDAKGEGEKKESKAMEFGTLIHKVILEPTRLHQEYISDVMMDKEVREMNKLTKAYKEAKAELEKDGRKLISDDIFMAANLIVDKVYAHPKAKQILNQGKGEKTIFAMDKETEMLCRIKPDYIRPDLGLALDVKTISDISTDGISRSLWDWRYHVQAAFYLRVLSQKYGVEFKRWMWLFIESKAPHSIRLMTPDMGCLDKGETDLAADLGLYASCVREWSWPDFGQDIEDVTLPAWAWGR